MFFVPENAPREDKAITDLINQGLDSERLFKAAWTLHQFKISQLQAQKGETSIQSGLFKGTILNPESFSSQFMPKYSEPTNVKYKTTSPQSRHNSMVF